MKEKFGKFCPMDYFMLIAFSTCPFNIHSCSLLQSFWNCSQISFWFSIPFWIIWLTIATFLFSFKFIYFKNGYIIKYGWILFYCEKPLYFYHSTFYSWMNCLSKRQPILLLHDYCFANLVKTLLIFEAAKFLVYHPIYEFVSVFGNYFNKIC